MDIVPQVASADAAQHSGFIVQGQRPERTTAAHGRFYRVMSAISLAIAILGFLPTFVIPVAIGTFKGAPIVYLHGVFFFAWTIFFVSQTWLAGRGRMLAHREWGVLGAALATAMLFTVITVSIVGMNRTPPAPAGSPAFAWAGVALMTYFVTCVAAGFANVRRPEVHKRFMLLATISLLGAPIGRWVGILFFVLLSADVGQAPPYWVLQLPGLGVDLLILAAMMHDRRSMGRISRVYLVGLPVLIAMNVTAPLISMSPAWLGVAGWLKGFGG